MSADAARKSRAPATGKRILINSHFVWNYGPVEYVMGAGLKERGHSVTMVACGGLPDYCQLQNSTQERPPCSHCLATVAGRFDAYQLPFTTISAHLTEEDFAHARLVAASTPLDALGAVMEGGINVGYLGYINLFQYFKGFSYAITPDVEAVWRRCVCSAILVTRASARIINEFQPDVFVTLNGKFLHWAPFIQNCALKGIPFVTWEDFQLTPSTVMFASNEIAHEQMQRDNWATAMSIPLNQEQHDEVRNHFKLWSTGEVTRWAGFGADASSDVNELRKRLRLSPDRPVISLFPNIAWDSSSVGFETAFKSIFDWLSQTIAYAARRPDLDFVIRAHPAEGRLPVEWRSAVPTCDAILKFGPPLPPNVRLVDAGDPVNSYALAEISSVCMVYTSTLGIELPLRGIRPWVAAGAYYAGKGLSVDITSPENMFSMLDANQFPPRLTTEEIERAERFVYLVRFRGTFEFPFLVGHDDVDIKNWSELGPKGNKVLDALSERIVNAKPMIDLRDPPQAPFGRAKPPEKPRFFGNRARQQK